VRTILKWTLGKQVVRTGSELTLQVPLPQRKILVQITVCIVLGRSDTGIQGSSPIRGICVCPG